ncbi:MAG: T9SS type A sorting domain-containing protein [Candidatus Latescibacterota bacterium]|nr:MAG: T9SS type A sorting domain-containing protein [Candidatus Latescibacterota bacterium]
MKTVVLRGIVVTMCLVMTPGVLAERDVGKSPPVERHVYETPSDIDSRLLTYPEGLFTSSPADTYVLAEYSFEDEDLTCDAQGWFGVDRTTQLDTFFHVDDFAGLNGGNFGRLTPLEGEKSLWCGARPSAESPYCRWTDLPGYGNNWEQFFECVGIPVVGDVIVSYMIRWDSEAGYDRTYLDYWDTNYDRWLALSLVNGGVGFYDGIGELTDTVVVSSSDIGDNLHMRFRFESDSGWSDEDGLHLTDGAVIIDALTLTDATGVIDYQDFEDEPVGATVTADGTWMATVPSGFGDYCGLYHGANVLQEDPCKFKKYCLWGFFNGSPFYYGCGGHPEQLVVPYPPGNGFYLKNEIWSPPLDWSTDVHGSPIPASASEAILEFDVYRDLPLDYMIFYVWHVRSWVDGCAGPWRDYNFVYYGGQKDWKRVTFQVGGFIDPDAEMVQIALGAWDMCEYWCGIGTYGYCHSQAPLLDDVRLVRVDKQGPAWSVRHFDLFQDNFPEDGDITCQSHARADMAFDMLPNAMPTIIPGDSAVVEVDDPSFVYTPLNPPAEDPDPSVPPQVYCWVRVGSHLCTPGHTPTSIESPDNTRYPGDPMTGTLRYPFTGQTRACGPWTYWQYQMDFVYSTGGGLVADRYCIDLMDIANGLHTVEDQTGNTGAFVPGDTIYYFFEAVPNSGLPTYWHRKRAYRIGQGAKHQTLSWEEVCHEPCEFMILPDSGREIEGDILLVDDTDDRGGPAEVYFDLSFGDLGLMNLTGERQKGPFYTAFTSNVDIFDVIGPSSVVGNGLASRVQNVQLQLVGDPDPVYKKIIWCSGDLASGTIGDGSPPNGGSGPEKSDDFGALHQFLEQRTGNAGVYISGDDVAYEWDNLAGANAVAMRNTYINFTLVSGNHTNQGIAISPLLVAELGSAFDDLVAGPDTLVARGGCPVINDFDVLQPTGAAVTELSYAPGLGAAVISQVVEDPQSGDQDARVILSGFSYHFIGDDRPGVPMDRVDHLRDILLWMDNAVPEPTGIGQTPKLANYLDNNYPNPFNPVTTIRYGIQDQTHVSLKIYNVAGQLVKTLVNEEQTTRVEGFKATWDGTNNTGEPFSSGVYFYMMVAKGFSKTKKMVLLK